ncbi:hypothetical protein Dda_0779 [Drechslerella dactyloides]|uniref:Uncharacterized protein n=1 Tax=Drechslerella dactyloides TaxID=74499 RepID=A0AAD6J705_DREDA|nr:hypothetical protein Dda_0779 [Drechslerella dactyloides]
MKSANYTSRKPKARIIASFDDDEADTPSPQPASGASSDTAGDAPLFKRKTASNRTRKGITHPVITLDDPQEGETSIDAPTLSRPVVVKKSTLSRQAVERNAAHSQDRERPRTTLKSTTLPSQPFSQLSLTSRPTYSKEALAELKGSTPTTPISHKDASTDEDTPMADAGSNDPLNVAGKFAAERAAPSNSAIPDEGTIKALKARRAMLAQNPDYISLSDASKHKSGSASRLQRPDDDEEELETFVEDGGLALGRKAERERDRRRREDIRTAIDAVERPSDASDASNSEEDEDTGEWEANRIRTGGYSSKRETLEEKLRKPPATITPLPSFGDALARLKGILEDMTVTAAQSAATVEELIAEREMIERREAEVQALLKSTADKYEKLREEVGAAVHVGRGLESFGGDATGDANGVPAA